MSSVPFYRQETNLETLSISPKILYLVSGRPRFESRFDTKVCALNNHCILFLCPIGTVKVQLQETSCSFLWLGEQVSVPLGKYRIGHLSGLESIMKSKGVVESFSLVLDDSFHVQVSEYPQSNISNSWSNCIGHVSPWLYIRKFSA